MSVKPAEGDTPALKGSKPTSQNWLQTLSWVIAFLMVALLTFLLLRRYTPVFSAPVASQGTSKTSSIADSSSVSLPELSSSPVDASVVRLADNHTIIPDRPRDTVQFYTVGKGDSVFGIANEFKLKPETILWANYNILQDNPDMLANGQTLRIPPTDGVYYLWQDGDTINSVASEFKVDPSAILLWPGNHLDMVNPTVTAGNYVMVPGGQRAFHQWLVPIAGRKNAGEVLNLLGPGACDVKGGAYGTGSFVWPAANHFLSGNDFSMSHLGIDIAAGLGAWVYAADSGVVIYAGPAAGGYGNVIMIDHGNGYQTLYAHNSVILTHCGASVTKGQVISQAGSTGNSTGPHLHFEVRYNGGFIDPWYVLPP
ncbi:MAG: peptidoglycan DD-metalloendopeptidase family protein [Anaerolineaceae bacterium]|nr:peptidoglycan DD-metalloendopeptidase family protein [Anaerolineaceae bacterium]